MMKNGEPRLICAARAEVRTELRRQSVTLKDQTALIVGASGGIGRAVAISLAEAGARVALVGRDPDKLAETRAALGEGGERAPILTCDVTDRAAVGEMVKGAIEALGSIQILVNAAGLNIRSRSLRAIDPADWDRVIAANLTAAFNLIHFVVPSMRERGEGLVILISSLSGLRASTVAGAAYSASKFGEAALGLCLGREERGRNLRSTVIYPGEVDTPFLDVRAARPGGGEAKPQRREGILQPADVAAAVRFIAELPPRAHVPELVIKPTIDDFS
jgi:NADP-dependent 3-hydroxy acid dehydrogenase YdfG